MREIKFRVWHKKEKRWLDPWAEEDPILSLKDFGRGCEVYLYDRKTQDHSNINCQMDDVVIQQYTGVKDKNGVEIYEGDLLITKFFKPQQNPIEVFWADAHSSWGVDAKMSSFLSQYAKNGQVAPLLNMHQEHYEVVGNIFEQLNLSDYQNENILSSPNLYPD